MDSLLLDDVAIPIRTILEWRDLALDKIGVYAVDEQVCSREHLEEDFFYYSMLPIRGILLQWDDEAPQQLVGTLK